MCFEQFCLHQACARLYTGSSLPFAHNASLRLIQQVLLTSYEPMQNTSVFATKARCKARCIWMHLDIPSPSPKCVIPWEPQVFFCGVSAHLTVISWVDLVLELPCRFSSTFARQQLVASFFFVFGALRFFDVFVTFCKLFGLFLQVICNSFKFDPLSIHIQLIQYKFVHFTLAFSGHLCLFR